MVMISTQNTKNAILFGILCTFCYVRQKRICTIQFCRLYQTHYHCALFCAVLGIAGSITYSLDGTNYSADLPTGTYAGTYNVYYKVAPIYNYNEFVSASPVSVSIGKATPTVTAPTATNPTYTGAAQDLITAGSTTGEVIEALLSEGMIKEYAPEPEPEPEKEPEPSKVEVSFPMEGHTARSPWLTHELQNCYEFIGSCGASINSKAFSSNSGSLPHIFRFRLALTFFFRAGRYLSIAITKCRITARLSGALSL